MALKFCRSLLYNTGVANGAKVAHIMKCLYEFWGFCVNGGSSLISPGGFYGSTTIAAGSNGVALPTGTINVVSTAVFPTSGIIYILTSTGTYPVAYTGKNATQFTGCTGGIGTMSTGNSVNSSAASTMPGNFNGVATTISSLSNGAILPQATINVIGATTGFPASGTIFVYTSAGTQTVAYTGVTATTFTGCTGGVGTMSTGGNVTSSSLMTIGLDGYTNTTTQFRYDGYTDFFATSAPFTANMEGKALVMWKPGSGSSEDSVYRIIAYKSPDNIVININNGGTPSAADGYKPTVSTRSSIMYRVVDIQTSTTLTADTNYYVMQLDPTGVNTGQANSQCKFTIATTNFVMNAQLSPGSTWTGSAFTDATTVINPNYGNTLNNATNASGQFYINMIGDKDYLFYEMAFEGNTFNNWMHLEIPERLYTQAQDLNPITISLNGRNNVDGAKLTTVTTTAGYGGGFAMKCFDNTTRLHRTLVKALAGDGNPNLLQSAMSVTDPPGNNLTDFRVGANPIFGTLLSSTGVLCLPGVVGQFSLSRVRLRRVRFANTFMLQGTRITSNGDFILLTQGVAIPWDKTVLPFPLFQF